MRNIRSILTVLFVACCGSAFAQSRATAGAGATVMTPISMTKDMDMNFGNAAVSATTGGYVQLSPGGTRTTSGGGVTLPATGGTVTAARFIVSGVPGFTYAITLPVSATISGPGAATMTVSSFTSMPATTGTLNATGSQALNIGATLHVSPGQAAGTYTNATAIPVTVNYN